MDIGAFLKEAGGFLRQDQVVVDREAMAHYSYDATERHFVPQAVVLPESTGEVSKLMRLAWEYDIPVTPQGGRTGLSGGALPVKGGVVLSLMRFNRIIEIDRENMIAVVEPGVISNTLQEELMKQDLFFPPDPSSTIESTLGGNVAENAGYFRAVKYGVTKDYVLGVEAVLPDGEIVNLGRKTVKNVAGYDLVSLLTGSEGTLAIITKIIFKLLPRPVVRRTVVVYLDDLGDAAEVMVRVFGAGIVPSAMEIMDRLSINAVADYLSMPLRRDAQALVLIEVDGHSGEAVTAEARDVFEALSAIGSVTDRALLESDDEAARIWRARRETLPALKAMGKDHLEADVVVPRFRLPGLVQAIQGIEHSDAVQIAMFGHGGDGNLHVTIMYRKGNFAELDEAHRLLEEVYRKAVEMEGSLTGEHGVGITVKDYLGLQLTETEIALMRRVKAAFDPRGLLNPGKIF